MSHAETTKATREGDRQTLAAKSPYVAALIERIDGLTMRTVREDLESADLALERLKAEPRS